MSRTRQSIPALLVALPLMPSPLLAQIDIDLKPIEYSTAQTTDSVQRLKAAIASGEVQLAYDRQLGWLPALLDALDTPANSQTLVFSKTSLQRRQISPSRPRALYFSDEVYIGYVRHGRSLELSAVDPKLGAVFYTVDQKNRERPVISRDTGQCLSCHNTRRTRDVPGYLVRSVFPDRRGEPITQLGSETADPRTPFKKRFGGWYVTGSHGGMRHRGNSIADEDSATLIDGEAGANLATLDGLVDTSSYLERGSDLVALMVLEHQSQMHNAITVAGYQARKGIYYDRALNSVTGDPPDTMSNSTRRRIESAGEALLQCLLFSGEAPLTSPVTGSTTFATDFAAQGPDDAQGRSLRQFDLSERLFRFPCSFLIYSDSWDALPTAMTDCLRRRLTEVLTGEDRSEAFRHLSAGDRRAILEILRATKPERLL
ncbi:MAG: hypothetical protein AAGJ46_07560 [Planctomycetota bacterium]